jgi:hypothetical protein
VIYVDPHDPRHGKSRVTFITALAVLFLGGGLVALGACGQPEGEQSVVGAAATQKSAGSPSAAATTVAAASPTGAASPRIETKTVTETKAIPFTTRRVPDPSLPDGTTKVTTRGVAGVKTLTYQVTYTDGVQTGKKLLREVVTKKPVTQVVKVGTKAAQRCDPNYSGACVPIASDVDCAGGGGNGPAYVRGPVRVIGTDIYDLDRDGDGIGCDS